MFAIKKISYILLLLLLCRCDGIIANHYASRANQPIDGSSKNNKFRADVIYYPRGNLQHLNDRKKRDNSVYFASAKMYNDIQYNVAKDYLGNYAKFLKIDAKEFEQRLKDENFGVAGKDILAKIESGALPVHPVKDNIVIMQQLKDEHDMVAFPDYMEEFLDVAESDKKKERAKEDKAEQIRYDENIFYALNDEDIRDAYVDYYLSISGAYSEEKKTVFKEKKID